MLKVPSGIDYIKAAVYIVQILFKSCVIGGIFRPAKNMESFAKGVIRRISRVFPGHICTAVTTKTNVYEY